MNLEHEGIDQANMPEYGEEGVEFHSEFNLIAPGNHLLDGLRKVRRCKESTINKNVIKITK